MLMPSEKKMREAVTARDKRYDGDFYYGVITTGVFCRPSCSSRAAKARTCAFFRRSAKPWEPDFVRVNAANRPKDCHKSPG